MFWSNNIEGVSVQRCQVEPFGAIRLWTIRTNEISDASVLSTPASHPMVLRLHTREIQRVTTMQGSCQAFSEASNNWLHTQRAANSSINIDPPWHKSKAEGNEEATDGPKTRQRGQRPEDEPHEPPFRASHEVSAQCLKKEVK